MLMGVTHCQHFLTVYYHENSATTLRSDYTLYMLLAYLVFLRSHVLLAHYGGRRSREDARMVVVRI